MHICPPNLAILSMNSVFSASSFTIAKSWNSALLDIIVDRSRWVTGRLGELGNRKIFALILRRKKSFQFSSSVESIA
jgi:hypothetical protein